MIGLVLIFIAFALFAVLANLYGAESRDGWPTSASARR